MSWCSLLKFRFPEQDLVDGGISFSPSSSCSRKLTVFGYHVLQDFELLDLIPLVPCFGKRKAAFLSFPSPQPLRVSFLTE